LGVVGPRGHKHLKSLGEKLYRIVFSEQEKKTAHVLQECVVLLVCINYTLSTRLELNFIKIFGHQVLRQLLVLQPQGFQLKLIFAILLPLIAILVSSWLLIFAFSFEFGLTGGAHEPVPGLPHQITSDGVDFIYNSDEQHAANHHHFFVLAVKTSLKNVQCFVKNVSSVFVFAGACAGDRYSIWFCIH